MRIKGENPREMISLRTGSRVVVPNGSFGDPSPSIMAEPPALTREVKAVGSFCQQSLDSLPVPLVIELLAQPPLYTFWKGLLMPCYYYCCQLHDLRVLKLTVLFLFLGK